MRLMKMIAVVSGILAISACAKTPEQRFEAMYQEQKATDPRAAASTALAYRYRDSLSDQDKMLMVDGWEELKAARARAGIRPGQ